MTNSDSNLESLQKENQRLRAQNGDLFQRIYRLEQIVDDPKTGLVEIRNAIRRFLEATGNDLCHENRAELAYTAGIDATNYPSLPPECEFAEKCIAYRQMVYGHQGPGSDAEVYEMKITRLIRALKELKDRAEDSSSIDIICFIDSVLNKEKESGLHWKTDNAG